MADEKDIIGMLKEIFERRQYSEVVTVPSGSTGRTKYYDMGKYNPRQILGVWFKTSNSSGATLTLWGRDDKLDWQRIGTITVSDASPNGTHKSYWSTYRYIYLSSSSTGDHSVKISQ